jgi:hypothetical protein
MPGSFVDPNPPPQLPVYESFRINLEFTAAHRVPRSAECAGMHGHNYSIELHAVVGPEVPHPEELLLTRAQTWVELLLANRLHLCSADPLAQEATAARRKIWNEPPTDRVFARHIFEAARDGLFLGANATEASGIRVIRVVVRSTPGRAASCGFEP